MAAIHPGDSWGLARPEPSLTGIMRVFDAAVIGTSLWALSQIWSMPWSVLQTLVAVAAMLLFVVTADNAGLYRSWRLGSLGSELRTLAVSWTLVLAALVLIIYLTKASTGVPRRVFVTWCIAVPALLGATRVAGRIALRSLRASGRNQRRVAIAGSGDLALRVKERVVRDSWMGLRLTGFYDEIGPGDRPAALRGDLNELVDLASRGDIDIVYIALPMCEEERMKSLVRRLSSTPVDAYLVPDLLAVALLRSRWCTFGSIPTVSLFESPLSTTEQVLKRVEDIVLATGALLLAALPMIAIAIGIKLNSKGPVLFKQARHGLGGQKIEVWKFRTMKVCESESEYKQATRDDPRLTSLGPLLRRTSLDELPQLVNVLQGRMSLVGPRPHPVRLNDQHAALIDWYGLRHRVKPGITGWAQVNGYRGETDTLDKMSGRIDRDLEYIHNWSVALDLNILARTVVRGFVNPNAY